MPLRVLRHVAVLSLLFACTVLVRADSVTELSDSFWQWRAQEQPFSDDDIPRLERPAGLVVDWSPSTIQQRMKDLEGFEGRWTALAPAPGTAVHDQVDYRLLGSAIARVRWELAIEQSWKRNPEFYVDQTLGSVYLLLLPPPPFAEARQAEIVARVKQIPVTLQAARENLTDMRQPFVQLGIDGLDHVADRLERMEKGLAPQLTQPISRRCKSTAGRGHGAYGVPRVACQPTALRSQRHGHWTRQLRLLPS